MYDLRVSLGVVGGWPAEDLFYFNYHFSNSKQRFDTPPPHTHTFFFPFDDCNHDPFWGHEPAFVCVVELPEEPREGSSWPEYRLPCLAAWSSQHWPTLCFSEWVTARISTTPEGAAGIWGRCVFAGKGFFFSFWNWKEACRHISGAGPSLRTRLPRCPLEWQLTLAVGNSPQPFTNFPLQRGAERRWAHIWALAFQTVGRFPRESCA